MFSVDRPSTNASLGSRSATRATAAPVDIERTSQVSASRANRAGTGNPGIAWASSTRQTATGHEGQRPPRPHHVGDAEQERRGQQGDERSAEHAQPGEDGGTRLGERDRAEGKARGGAGDHVQALRHEQDPELSDGEESAIGVHRGQPAVFLDRSLMFRLEVKHGRLADVGRLAGARPVRGVAAGRCEAPRWSAPASPAIRASGSRAPRSAPSSATCCASTRFGPPSRRPAPGPVGSLTSTACRRAAGRCRSPRSSHWSPSWGTVGSRSDLRESSPGPLPALIGRPGLTEHVVGLIEWVWTHIVAADWPRRERVLRADIVSRTTRLAQHGWSGVLGDLRREIAWLGEAGC